MIEAMRLGVVRLAHRAFESNTVMVCNSEKFRSMGLFFIDGDFGNGGRMRYRCHLLFSCVLSTETLN